MKNKSNYSNPTLREKLKDKIMAGDRGGKPGQWSARKAQMLASEYKKAGGKYKKGLSKPQKDLKKWTGEDWMTRSQYETGKSDKAITDKYTKRYLPRKAWSKLDPNERISTDVKKRTISEKGKQFVANTAKAKSASKKARNS